MYKIIRAWICTSGIDVGQHKVQLIAKYDNDKDARDCWNTTKLLRYPGEQVSLVHNGNFLCGKV